jgi:uncharacterized membrane protein YozB (DUF420 family)
MTIRSLLGYIIAIVGLLGLAITLIPQFRDIIPIPEEIAAQGNAIIMVASLVITAIGIFIVWQGSNPSQKGREVPIFQGSGKKRKIVGYQRH